MQRQIKYPEFDIKSLRSVKQFLAEIDTDFLKNYRDNSKKHGVIYAKIDEILRKIGSIYCNPLCQTGFKMADSY